MSAKINNNIKTIPNKVSAALFKLKNIMKEFKFIEGEDYYLENGEIILTPKYLKKRGKCCSSKCRHCIYWPPHQKGNTKLDETISFND
jgi:hypothetical protein